MIFKKPLGELSFKERILHSLISFGIPMAAWSLFFPQVEGGFLIIIVIALIEGASTAFIFAILEHLYFTKK